MLRRKSYAATSVDDTPFHRGRQIWDDRIGGPVVQARNWRLVAVVLACLSLLLTGGIVYTATTVRVYPYVIEVAETGQVRTVGQLVNPTYVIPDKTKEYLVKEWIENVRGLSTDPIMVKANLEKAWVFAGDRVQHMIRPHIERMAENARLPDRDIRRRAIIVKVHTVLPITPNTYRVDWTEELFNLVGKSEDQPERWAATLTLKDLNWSPTAPMTKERDQYPLGVYLYDLNWSRVTQ